jgi:Protein of unknown function (DUF3551)
MIASSRLKNTESNMSKTIAFSTIAASALVGTVFLSAAEPVAAREYQYCREDYSSDTRQCGFDTVEQCVTMISGRGGSCVRNPLLFGASASYAHASKRHGNRRRQRPD